MARPRTGGVRKQAPKRPQAPPKKRRKKRAKKKSTKSRPPRPSISKYADVLDSIDAPCVRLSALQEPDTGRRYAIRHDIDVSLVHALAFARAEAKRSIHSTYFLLHTAPYFKAAAIPDAVREFIDLGHDVGLHHNALYLIARKLTKDPREILKRSLALLRKGGPIIGAAAHGDSWAYRYKYRNYQIWSEFDPKGHEKGDGKLKFKPISLDDLGLDYEAYFLTHDHYLTDSGGRWGSWAREHPRPFERMRCRKNNVGEGVVPAFNEREDATLQVLVHPCHWKV